MNLKTLLEGPIPQDLTLGELRRSFSKTSIHDGLLEAIENDKGRYLPGLKIRFVYTKDLTDCSDEMTLSDFRQLSIEGLTKIIIEDDDGGLKVKKPELVS